MRPLYLADLAAIAVIALVVAMLLVFANNPSAVPVYAQTPTVPPAMRLVDVGDASNVTCILKRPAALDVPASALVTVDASPKSVTAVWIPGMNSRACRSIMTRGNHEFATALASTLTSEPPVANGTYMCPNWDGNEVRLYFNYGAGRQSELAIVDLVGCTWIAAPGRSSRWWSEDRAANPEFRSLLTRMAPEPWKSEIPKPTS